MIGPAPVPPPDSVRPARFCLRVARLDGKGKMSFVGWTRYEGRALADLTLDGDALFAELEDYVRVHNPHFTDIRMERATATRALSLPRRLTMRR